MMLPLSCSVVVTALWMLQVVLVLRAAYLRCCEGLVTPSDDDDVVAHMPRSVLRHLICWSCCCRSVLDIGLRWCYIIVGLVNFRNILKMYLAFWYIGSSVDDLC